MGVKIIKKPAVKKKGKAVITKKTGTGAEITEEQTVELPASVVVSSMAGLPGLCVAPESLAHVSVEMGYTKNLGNFSSCKMGVMLSMPSAPTDVDSTFKFVHDWVDQRLGQMVEDVPDEAE